MPTEISAPLCPRSDIDPFSEEFLTDPFGVLHDLRAAGPVVFLTRYDIWALARHEQVEAVLRDPVRFASGAGVGLHDARQPGYWRRPSLLLETDRPLHDRTRAAVAAATSPYALRSLRDIFETEAVRLADSLVARGRFDAVRDLAEPFAVEVFANALGLERGGREHLLRYGSMVFNGFGPPNRLFAASMNHADETLAWISAHCARAALRPGSLGAEVYRAADAGDVTEAEAQLLVRSFLSAGLETTVAAIAFGILEFANCPEQWQLLHDDPALARNAFEEVVRLHSTLSCIFRTTTQPVVIAGTPVPADAKVLLFFSGANRDPQRWERPDAFDVRRRVGGHLGFGMGLHNCVGASIARVEGETLFRALAERVRSWHLDGQPTPRLNNTTRGLETLPVRAIPA